MKLLPNETTIKATSQNRVILTNFRIIKEETRLGNDYHLSIFLEDISSIELHYRSLWYLLLFGILSILFFFFNIFSDHQDIESKIAPLFLGIILILAWWYSRRFTITIKPNGGEKLNCVFGEVTDQNIQDFLYQIESAKLERIHTLYLNDSNKSTSSTNLFTSKTDKKTVKIKSKCPSCNYTISENDTFCENCGTKLN